MKVVFFIIKVNYPKKSIYKIYLTDISRICSTIYTNFIWMFLMNIFLYLKLSNRASQVVLVVQNVPTNTGNLRDGGSIPGSGRSPGEGNGNPVQYSCLGNSMAEELCRLQSIEFQRVGYDWSDLTHPHAHITKLSNSNPVFTGSYKLELQIHRSPWEPRAQRNHTDDRSGEREPPLNLGKLWKLHMYILTLINTAKDLKTELWCRTLLGSQTFPWWHTCEMIG